MACTALVVVTQLDLDNTFKHSLTELRYTFYLTNGTDFLLTVGTSTSLSNYFNKLDLEIGEVKSLSRVRLSATLWTVAYQAPPSMGFSRQEYWSGLPFPSPGNLPNPGIEPRSPALEADALTSEPPGKPHTWIGPKSQRWPK